MKALTTIAVILALAALGVALFAGYRLERRLEDRPETVSRAEVKALSADLVSLERKLAAVEDRLEKTKAAPDPEEVPIASIIPLLRHMDPNVRRSAVEILKGLKDPAAVPALRAAALKDVDPSVRLAAFHAIGSLGGEEARRFLLEAVSSSDGTVSSQAVEQLAKVGRAEDFDVVAAVFDREIAEFRAKGGRETYLPPAVRSPLKVMVDLAPARSLSRVIAAVKASPTDHNARSYLNRVVTAENVAELIEAVLEVPVAGAGAGGRTSSANSLHHAALMAMRSIKDKRALPYVVRLLEGEDPTLRSAAARAIGEIGGPEAFGHLEKALKRALEEVEKQASYSSSPVITLIDAVRSTKDKRACALLVAALGSKHSQVACYAASGLSYCVDPAQGEAIFKAWQETTDTRLKGALRNVLQYKREYGYTWDQEGNTFRKTGAPEEKAVF